MKINNLTKLALIIIPIPFLLLSFFNQPSADDYCYANSVLEEGFWNYQLGMYNNWSGRYFGTFANSLYSEIILLLGKPDFIMNFLEGYKLIALFLFSAFFIALLSFLKASFKTLISRQNIFWISLLFFDIYITRMPSVAEGFYWFNGAFYYTIGSLSLFLLLSLLVSSHHVVDSRIFSKKFFYILACIVLTVAGVGASEIVALLFLAIVFIGVIISSYKKHPSTTIWRIVLSTTIISMAILLLSPGSAKRQEFTASLPHSPKLLAFYHSLSGVIQIIDDFIHYLESWVLDPTLLSASLLFIPIAIILVIKNNFSLNFTLKVKISLFLAYVIIWLLLIFSTFFIPPFSAGYLPVRVKNVSYLTFLLGWFFGITLLICTLPNLKIKTFTIPNFVLIAAQVVMILGFIFQGNFVGATSDLFVNAPRYYSELDKRYELIEQVTDKHEKKLQVPALIEPLPKTIYVDGRDIERDAKEWKNICFAKFFNLESISTQ